MIGREQAFRIMRFFAGSHVERSAIAREVRSESRDVASRLATIRAAKKLAVSGVDLHSTFGSGRIKTDIPIG